MADLVIVKGSRYSCNECGKSFTSEKSKTHIIGFIQVVNHSNVLLGKKTFFQACHLRTHELTYSGIAYQKIFSRASNLDKQEKTHTTVKDFKCITCPKTFT